MAWLLTWLVHGLAIALMAVTRASLTTVIVAITIPEIPRVARLVRSLALTLREQLFVEAAHLSWESGAPRYWDWPAVSSASWCSGSRQSGVCSCSVLPVLRSGALRTPRSSR